METRRPTEGLKAPLSTIERVLEILRPYPFQAIVAVGLTIVACLLNLPVPFLIQGLVDTVVTGGHWSALPAFAVGLLIVFAAQAGFSLANTLVVGKVGQQVVRDLRHRLYERLQRLDLSYYDRTPTGGIISRLMDDVGVLQGLITAQTVTILTDLGTTLAITALLVGRSGRLALVVLAFVPLYVVNFRYFMVRIRTNSTIVRDKMDIVFGMLKEKLDGTQVIKACSRELAEMDDFADQLEDAHGPRVRDNTLRAAFSGLCTMISGAGTAAVFAMGAYEVLQGTDDSRRCCLDGRARGLAVWTGCPTGGSGLGLRASGSKRGTPGRDSRSRTMRSRARESDAALAGSRLARVRPCGIWIHPRSASALGCAAHHRAGHEGRARGTDGLWEEHARQPVAPLLRSHLGRDPPGWPAAQPTGARQPAPANRGRPARTGRFPPNPR